MANGAPHLVEAMAELVTLRDCVKKRLDGAVNELNIISYMIANHDAAH